jgi:hypothetical protein
LLFNIIYSNLIKKNDNNKKTFICVVYVTI